MSALNDFKKQYGNTPSAVNAELFLKRNGVDCNLTILNSWLMYRTNKLNKLSLSEIEEIINFVNGKK